MYKITNKLKTVHISFIYLHLIYLFISIYIDVVLFAWLFPYKGPEMCQVFRQVSFLMIGCHYVAVFPRANRCTADCGFEYRYICPFRGTLECAVILDNLIQIFLHLHLCI